MTLDLDLIKQYRTEIDSLSYRGHTVKFYEDIPGKQIIAIWKDKIFEFGLYNTMYKDDMKMVIDAELDVITRFEEQPAFHGARLEYFQNEAFSDVRLIYRGRLLKVFLNPQEVGLGMIENLAVETLLEEIRRRNETNT